MTLTLSGEKLYQRRAQKALPVLVRQAIAERPIAYSALAAELGMPNPRNLNYVLGAVGTSLQELSRQWNQPVPPIQFLVLQKHSGVPGPGVSIFTDAVTDFGSLTLRQKRLEVQRLLGEIYRFPNWPAVLTHFGLAAAPPAIDTESLLGAVRWHGSGESEAHRQLKEYVARSPSLVGLPGSTTQSEVEHCLPSGDAVDVLFRSTDMWIAVEVKAANAPSDDVLRGLFQCVKYKAVAAAVVAVGGGAQEVDSVLVLGRSLPSALVPVRNALGIRIIENVIVR